MRSCFNKFKALKVFCFRPGFKPNQTPYTAETRPIIGKNQQKKLNIFFLKISFVLIKTFFETVVAKIRPAKTWHKRRPGRIKFLKPGPRKNNLNNIFKKVMYRFFIKKLRYFSFVT